jgi:hypothetical protein
VPYLKQKAINHTKHLSINLTKRVGCSIKLIKLLYFSPANAEYFVVLGDTYKAQAEMSRNSDGLLSKAKDTYEKALKATEEKAEEFRSIVEEKVNEVSEKLK